MSRYYPNHELLGRVFTYTDQHGKTFQMTCTSVQHSEDSSAMINFRGPRYTLWQWPAWKVRSLIRGGQMMEI